MRLVGGFTTRPFGIRDSAVPTCGRAGFLMVSSRRALIAAWVRKCPKCRGEMRERVNRRTGEVFLGCAAFPRCTGTKPLPGSSRPSWPALT